MIFCLFNETSFSQFVLWKLFFNKNLKQVIERISLIIISLFLLDNGLKSNIYLANINFIDF